MKRPERALILLKPQYLGDAVMACPLIDSIAAAYDKPFVMCGPLVQEVLADRSGDVRFEPGQKLSGIAPVFRAARALRALHLSHAYLVNRSFRSALAVRMAGIPVRVGHATEGRGFLLTHRVPYDQVKFEAECYLDLARAMNVETADPKPRLTVSEAEAHGALKQLQGADRGIQPGARYSEKLVPLPDMAKVARYLQSKGHRVVLLGGGEEAPYATEFQSLLEEPVVDLVGKLPIRETMGALATLSLMVGSDTGLMHLAAALGCPTITVFGPNPASKWGHNYAPHDVIPGIGGKVPPLTPEEVFNSTS